MRALQALCLLTLWGTLSSCSPGPEFRTGDMLSAPTSEQPVTWSERIVTWKPDPQAHLVEVESRQRLTRSTPDQPTTLSVYLTNARQTPDSSLTMWLDGVKQEARRTTSAPVPVWWPKRIETHIRKWPTVTSRVRYATAHFPQHTTRYDVTLPPGGATHELVIRARFQPPEMTADAHSWGMLLGEYAAPGGPDPRYEIEAPAKWEVLSPGHEPRRVLSAAISANERGLYALGARPQWPQANIDEALDQGRWALAALTLLYLVVFLGWVRQGTRTERRRLVLTLVFVPLCVMGLTRWEDHATQAVLYPGWSHYNIAPQMMRNLVVSMGAAMLSWFLRLLPLWLQERQ